MFRLRDDNYDHASGLDTTHLRPTVVYSRRVFSAFREIYRASESVDKIFIGCGPHRGRE